MVWHIDEFSHTLLDGSSVGQFYSGDSYIIQWTYSVTITGELFIEQFRERRVYLKNCFNHRFLKNKRKIFLLWALVLYNCYVIFIF